MKRLLLVLSVAVAGVLALVVSAASGTDTATVARTITVVERATTDTTTDTGKKGDSVGDVLTFSNKMYDAANEKQVGTDQGYCVRVAKGSAYECNWTVLLDGGNIAVEGPFYDTKGSTLAITGGTGAYAKARGTMGLKSLDGGKAYRFTYNVKG